MKLFTRFPSLKCRLLLAGAACAATVLGAAERGRAAPMQTFQFTLDTASLAADTADQPFTLALQINGGGTPGVENTATFSNFNFSGGSAGSITTPSSGDVSSNGSLSSGVTLDTGASDSTFSSFSQNFTPGMKLTFVVATSEQLVDPTQYTPDNLSVQILDSGGLPVGTTDPDGSDSLISITYSNPLDIETYGSDTTQQTSTGQTLPFEDPSYTVVTPEPSSLAVLTIASAGLLMRRRRITTS